MLKPKLVRGRSLETAWLSVINLLGPREKRSQLSGNRILSQTFGAEAGIKNHDDATTTHLQHDNADDNTNISIEQNGNETIHSYSVRLNESQNDTEILNSSASIESHINNTNDENQNKTQSIPGESDKPPDTIFDDLRRGFTFAALFCLGLFFLYKFCCYACIRCGLCPDERVMEARMRKLRLMRKRSYYHHPSDDGGGGGDPPLDTRKWAEWMMANRGAVDTADTGFNDGYYYSAAAAASSGKGIGGVWDDDTNDSMNEDGSATWDDETGFVDFDHNNAGVELAFRSTKSAVPELEYGEGDELEDEIHDSRLFDAEDGGKGVDREADKFFKGGHRGREVGGNFLEVRKNDGEGEPDTKDVASKSIPTGDSELNQLIMPEQTLFEMDVSGNPSSLITMTMTEEHDGIQIMDNENWERSGEKSADDDEEMNTAFDEVDDRGYDEETDLLGLRSDSPPPLNLEEMSRIEKNLLEAMEDTDLSNMLAFS